MVEVVVMAKIDKEATVVEATSTTRTKGNLSGKTTNRKVRAAAIRKEDRPHSDRLSICNASSTKVYLSNRADLTSQVTTGQF